MNNSVEVTINVNIECIHTCLVRNSERAVWTSDGVDWSCGTELTPDGAAAGPVRHASSPHRGNTLRTSPRLSRRCLS